MTNKTLTSSSNTAILSGLDSLKDLLSDVLTRLEQVEAKVGVSPSPMSSSATTGTPKSTKGTLKSATLSTAAAQQQQQHAGESPAVKAYDAYVKSCVVPFAQTCDSLEGLQNMGQLLQDAFEGVRFMIVLASRSKPPTSENGADYGQALAPYLTKTQTAVQAIRNLKLDRDYDRHHKAVMEMLSCLSWILYKAPQQLPASVVKESLGSAEFWSNRIRKDYKGKNETQIAFCDNLKKVIVGLTTYVEDYHKTGLTFNVRSNVSLAETAIVLADEPADMAMDLAKSPGGSKRHLTLGTSGGSANLAGLMGELNKRKSEDGNSAATGLKHVTKDQQTWRKEFKKPTNGGLPEAPNLDASKDKKEVVAKKKKPLMGLPVFEYQDRGFKWVIENQTSDTIKREINKDGIITIDISDPKQQVYLYNCDGAMVQIKGKFKSLVLDKCTNCSVVYETLISSAEVVNCKSIKLQVTGVCPVFTIDKTINFLVWLSTESLPVSTFTTSLSSEMNVSYPDGDDMKEVPIPEQFVHRVNSGKGKMASEVSDLYH